MQVVDTNNYVTADGAIHHNSGKSVGVGVELYRRACLQEPDSKKIRPTKFLVVRSTYGQLDDTTIPDFLEWFPDGEAGIYVKSKRTFNLEQELDDGTVVESKFIFRALDKPQDVEKIKGLQVTGTWANEFRSIPLQVLIDMVSRRARYPSRNKRVPPTWSGLIGDSQPPDRTSDYYKFFQNAARYKIDRRDGEASRPVVELFRQPSGLAKNAENTKNLDPGYYAEQEKLAKLTGKSEDWINVHIHGEYGFIPNGKPVYGNNFKHVVHVSPEPLEIIPGRTIGIGYDPGLVNSAAIIGQLTDAAQWRFYREILTEGVSIDDFVQQTRMALAELGARGERVIWYVDPAAKIRSSTDMRSAATILIAEKFRVVFSEKGRDTRVGAMRGLLNSPRLSDNSSRLVIDPSMEMLIEGMLGGYMFRNVQRSGGGVRQIPDKGPFSHVCNAAEYLVALFELARQKGHKKLWPDDAETKQKAQPREIAAPGQFDPHHLFAT